MIEVKYTRRLSGRGLKSNSAIRDLLIGLSNLKLADRLARSDIKARYRRSLLGPIWLLIGTLGFIAGFSFLGSFIFRMPWQTFLPYLATGVIYWQFLNTAINESTTLFQGYIDELLSTDVSIIFILERFFLRQVYTFLHSVPALLLIPYALNGTFPNVFLAAISFIVVLFMLVPLSLLLAFFAFRFRDIVQAVAVISNFSVYVSPVWWDPTPVLETTAAPVIYFNPIYHVMNLLRNPIIGREPQIDSYLVICGIAIFFWILALFVFFNLRGRIKLWA